jgi:hypothetical protein
MKKTLTLFFLISFVAVLYSQHDNKYDSQKKGKNEKEKLTIIPFGTDPVDPTFEGKPGMIPVKYLGKPETYSQGRSGKVAHGLMGEGELVWIDSAKFFEPWTIIDSGIVWQCGNPSYFPGGLKRSLCRLVSPQIIDGVPCYEIDSLKNLIARELNLLSDDIRDLGLEVATLSRNMEVRLSHSDAKLDSISRGINLLLDQRSLSQSDGFWRTAWPWVIGSALVVGTAAYLICRANIREKETLVIDRSGWIPPDDPPLGKPMLRFGFGVPFSSF